VDAKAVFDERIEDIQAIIDVPSTIRGIAIDTLRSVDKGGRLNNPIANGIHVLENIQVGSIAKSYDAIFNLVCVLTVSVLADSFKSLFVEYGKANGFSLPKSFSKKINIDVRQLVDINPYSNTLPQVIIQHDLSIQFEDLQSVVRTFKDYYQYDLNLSSDEEKMLIFQTSPRIGLIYDRQPTTRRPAIQKRLQIPKIV
jgi:hypothetical protein